MMKTKSLIAASTLALAMASGSAMAFEKGVSVSADGGNMDDTWSATVQMNGYFNSVSMSQYVVGGDSVKTIDYKHQLTNLDSPIKMTVGLSAMKSDYSDKNLIESLTAGEDHESGYALGVHVGFGYDIAVTGTTIHVGLTEEVVESRFADGQIFEAGVTQQLAKNLSVTGGFRQIDREIDGAKDELLETGYIGLKFNF